MILWILIRSRPSLMRIISSACIALFLAFVATGLSQDRPNIILVMADDLGWGDVGFNGNTLIHTPHLDAMAANGLVFNRFYAAGPVCSPTRGSCLTGRHPVRLGIPYANSGHLRPEEETLAEIVKVQGYATGHFGKWHLGTLTKTVVEANRGGPRGAAHFSPPQAHGFDICIATESKVPTHDPMRKPKTYCKGESLKIGWDAIVDQAQSEHYRTHYWDETGTMVVDKLLGDDSKVIMDRALPFIEKSVADKKPFFSVIWFHAPHLPVVASEAHRDLYKKLDLHHRNYFGCISAIDEQIGRLRGTLRDLKVADNTMIWFCSDNGPEGNAKSPGSSGPFRGRKRSLYEGGVRVPGVLEWPSKITKAVKTEFPAVTSDYLPTILSALGLPASKRTLDGIDLMPLILGNKKERQRSEAIGFHSGNQLTWNTHQYKLVHDDKKDTTELYDLQADPSETQDLAKSMPDKVTELKAALIAWKEACAKSARGED